MKTKQKSSVFNRKIYSFGAELYLLMKHSCQCPVIALSPLSIHFGLGLVYMTACQNTKAEIRKVLKLGNDETDTLRSFYRSFCKYRNDPDVLLANKIYIHDDFNVVDRMVHLAEDWFLSSFGRVNFDRKPEAARQINGWVEEQTENKLRKTVPLERIYDGTCMIMVSGIYQKAKWSYPFNVQHTSQEDFYLDKRQSVAVTMMKGYGLRVKAAQLTDINCTAVELPFEGDDLAMLIILPDSYSGIDQLESKLPDLDIAAYRGCMKVAFTTVILPRFRVEYKAELKANLSKMGMPSMFNEEKANFVSLIEGGAQDCGIHFSRIVHHTLIIIGEGGINVPASKAVRPEPRHLKERILNVNHPFIFGIFSKTHRPFVLGCVRNPKPGTKCK